MVVHDLACVDCDRKLYDVLVDSAKLPACPDCGAACEVRWDISRRPINLARHSTVHARERTVVWKHPKTGVVSYPPMADAPMPDRYRKQGFERVEFETQRSLDKFCDEKKVLNERSHFDNNGKADGL